MQSQLSAELQSHSSHTTRVWLHTPQPIQHRGTSSGSRKVSPTKARLQGRIMPGGWIDAKFERHKTQSLPVASRTHPRRTQGSEPQAQNGARHALCVTLRCCGEPQAREDCAAVALRCFGSSAGAWRSVHNRSPLGSQETSGWKVRGNGHPIRGWLAGGGEKQLHRLD